MQGARSRRATLHVRNAFPACNLAPRERAKTEQTLNVWLVIYRTKISGSRRPPDFKALLIVMLSVFDTPGMLSETFAEDISRAMAKT